MRSTQLERKKMLGGVFYCSGTRLFSYSPFNLPPVLLVSASPTFLVKGLNQSETYFMLSTYSLPAMPNCLQNPKWLPGGPKMADAVWKGVKTWVIERSEQLQLNMFFDPSTPPMRKVDNGEKKRK